MGTAASVAKDGEGNPRQKYLEQHAPWVLQDATLAASKDRTRLEDPFFAAEVGDIEAVKMA